jgi:WD40 repeat protein
MKFGGEEHFCPSLMDVMFEGDSRDGVSSLAVSRSRRPFICSGHSDFVVRVWDLIKRKLLFVLRDHIDWVVSVAVWKGPEPMAVSGTSDGTIKSWDLQTGALMTTCEGHLRDVWSVTVTEGPKPLIVSASVDRTMCSWDVNQFLVDTTWERRQNFCIFVYCSKLIYNGVTASFSDLVSDEKLEGAEGNPTARDEGSSGDYKTECEGDIFSSDTGMKSLEQGGSLRLVFQMCSLCKKIAGYL